MPKPKSRRNISRIETKNESGKSYCGWEVRIQRRGKKTAKFFGDNRYGGKRKSLAEAKSFRDQIDAQSKRYSVQELAQTPSARNKSGDVGVRLHKQKDARGDYEYHYWYWVAQWVDASGKRRTQSFSIHRHGDQEAYRLACQARKQGIANANRSR